MKNMWNHLLLALCVGLAAPLLMGPQEMGCHVCLASWSSSVGYDDLKEHELEVRADSYYALLSPETNYAASLSVEGDVSNVSCTQISGNYRCTFDGTTDGVAVFVVTGAPGPTSYILNVDYDD